MLSYLVVFFFLIEEIGWPFISHISSLLAYKEIFKAWTASARHSANKKMTKAAEHCQISNLDKMQGLGREPKCCLILIFKIEEIG